MGNFGVQNLLNTAGSSLRSQTQAIRIVGNNVANVNTEGYSRRTAELVSLRSINIGDSNIGAGVTINQIVRSSDQFVNRELIQRITERASVEIKNEFLSRAEQPFQLDAGPGTIGYELTNFFSALEDLSLNPSQIPLRSQVITQGNALVEAIKNAYNQTATLQREADSRIGFLVQEVNRISEEIAELNRQIISSENAGNQTNLTLRDQRDELLRRLNEIVQVQSVEANDGGLLIFLDNGFSLVNREKSTSLDFTFDPSFAPAGGYPPGLDGAGLGHIVFDFDPTPGNAHIDLTRLIASGEGELGGLLAIRGIQSDTDTSSFDAVGDLPLLAGHIEAISVDLLTRFNQEYLGPDEDPLTPGHQPSALDGNGNPVSDVFGLFTFPGAVDVDGDGLPTTTDLLGSGRPVFSSVLEFAISDPSRLAAGRDVNPVPGAIEFAPGDSSNIQALIELSNQRVNHSIGQFNSTSTIAEVYNLSVTFVGGRASSAKNDLFIKSDREVTARELHASVTGVSLDEEFANLIKFQKAYQGAARFIRIGDELLQELINLL